MAKPISRIPALKNTWSGLAGEARVAAQLVAFGLYVAKPYWNDDEIDLLILEGANTDLLPIPVQAKAVQDDGADHIATVQGLRRMYVDRQPALCLAIWSPRWDRIWFIDGSDNIKAAYTAQAASRKGKPGRPKPAYETLKDDDDVRLQIDLSAKGNADFDSRWLVNHLRPSDLTNRVFALAKRMRESKARVAVYAEMFKAAE